MKIFAKFQDTKFREADTTLLQSMCFQALFCILMKLHRIHHKFLELQLVSYSNPLQAHIAHSTTSYTLNHTQSPSQYTHNHFSRTTTHEFPH